MLGSAIIVFREVLEAALIIAVIMGASRGVAGRTGWISMGIGIGVIGACVVAALAGTIASGLDGVGQEVFNAAILLTAVAMLGWHNIWMSSHGQRLAAELRTVGHDVSLGVKPLSLLLIVTALAVLREGSETVLFLYGVAASGVQALNLMTGGFLGLAAGGIIGWLVYRGLLSIPIRYFFIVTGWVVLLLAAGLAASAAGYLAQAGLLPSLGGILWDTSNLLDQQSWLGTLLHVLVGYNDHPTGIQLVLYLATLLIISGLMQWIGRGTKGAMLQQRKITTR